MMVLSLLAGVAMMVGQAQPASQANPVQPNAHVPIWATLGTPLDAPATAVNGQAAVAKEAAKPNVSGDGRWTDDGTGNGSAIFGPHLPNGPEGKGFFHAMVRAYVDEFRGVSGNATEAAPPARRGLPEPWSAPPFPGHEYQGYPLIGVPKSSDTYPLMKGIYSATSGTDYGEALKDSGIKAYGWVTAGGNYSTAKFSNLPTAYWVVPNRLEMDQAILRIEREVDTVQTDHVDWGFRSTYLYGIDYRFMTAGGWFSDQLLKNNRLYGFDPSEQYFDLYVPGVADGFVLRVGRWVACPDIETQFAPDNYMASHSLLFAYDTYTQTGFMGTVRLNDQWMFQAAITAGTDMAPWYAGATPTGMFAIRWVSQDNNDAFYTVLNNINDARFRNVYIDGQYAGHDNFNYIVSTWEHRFNALCHTKTEAYFMWQRDAYVGGSVSIGTPQSFGSGGGAGAFIPGYALNYGVLNYTMFQLSKSDYLTVRNEIWNDPQGERTGFETLYSSHSIGWSHNFNALMQVRPEVGFYHSYNQRAFDLGTTRNLVMAGFDFTFRF